jgi:hypothetical protein
VVGTNWFAAPALAASCRTSPGQDASSR